jgi:superfamily II DNA or RNA helicase
MQLTDYHAKFYAHELTRVGGSGVDRLGRALFDASVALNPHQIEAALFALRSPLSKGVLLADEVGLGKTIEAGLVLCQLWAERRRRLLVICPASLRKQWSLELVEKFNLPSVILDARTFKEMQKAGIPNPFRQDAIIITSLHYAAACESLIQAVEWDTVVVDEAHKLRNAYRESNRIGQAIRRATAERRKILLTATPLQNSLVELYGLSTLIDDNLFGDLPSFRTQYMNAGGDLPGLRERLRAFCWRTLRKDVLEYVKYTQRRLITRPFTPTDEEHKLYEAVSAFLQREHNYALPTGQRHLLILLVRKVLASSPQAVAGTLEIIRDRLLRVREEAKENASAIEQLIAGEELDPDLLDELLEDQDDLTNEEGDAAAASPAMAPTPIDFARLDREIQELEDYIRWARSMGVDTKTRALLKALDIGFTQMAGINPPAPKKAVVFTESRRTQAYLRQFLEANGYAGKVLTFNGTNTDPDSVSLYQGWLAENKDTGRATGSRAVDLRTAIIDRFRDSAEILIATEAAAEGINLQFCAMVVNHDLPWNPQRIEQRIGRCHRYGQAHDVVVINFLNERNEADQRVHQLLDSKFNLFSGVFGASDEVLGTIESGVDFERRVLEIYQQCRSQEEIAAAFKKLQDELDERIKARLSETRRQLLEHFDEDVHARLKMNLSGARDQLDRIGRMFWALTGFELSGCASLHDEDLSFDLHESPVTAARPGHYQMISKGRANIPGEFLYRLSHPLGEHVILQGRGHACPVARLTFDISSHPLKVSVVEALKGRSGWLHLQHLRIDSFEREEFLLFSAFDDSGADVDQETCLKLFSIGAQASPASEPDAAASKRLSAEATRHVQATIARSLEANNQHFAQARDQLDQWAEDMELAAQKELEDTKRQIRDLQRRSRQAPTLAGQHQMQEQISALEKSKRRLRQRIFDIEDEIAAKRDALVAALERRMRQKTEITPLFTIQWSVI